jgi:hypothetical protein
VIGAVVGCCLAVVLRCGFVYHESIKREPKIRGINKCRCDARLELHE